MRILIGSYKKCSPNHPDLFELMYCYDLPPKINIHVKKLQNDIVKFQNKDEEKGSEF